MIVCRINTLRLLIRLAQAHTRSESHTSWLIDAATVHLTFSVADLEAKRLTGNASIPSDAQLIAYLASRETVSAKLGSRRRPCPLLLRRRGNA